MQSEENAQEQRPEPETFLDLEQTPAKGRLKIYLGAAAGVGKSYQMLKEAHELKARGIDVVLGFIEPHGRAETAALIEGLEAVPRRQIAYRGVTLEEMDLDAILARAPTVAIVDELAHTNVPGTRHEKRYQDIESLLAAGINVITAVNVQHIESLNPVMRRITGVVVRETVPDSFIMRANQLVTIDLDVETLRQRLREGKIYPAEQIDQALKNFFKPSNLVALRELALREVARTLERQREVRQADTGKPSRITERVMVGLSSNPIDSDLLLRKACRIAGQLNASWYAVHVETPRESVSRISTRDFVALLDNINLASDLGAETVWLKSDDVVKALLDFARERGVTKLVVGESRQPLWRRLIKRSVPMRLLGQAEGLDMEIVSHDSLEGTA